MIILGLGSNVGDRLSHLRSALRAIKAIAGVRVQQVSPLYISDALLPDNAPADWDQPFLNLALRCETALTPPDFRHELKKIEGEIGRVKNSARWAPRTIDIDILAWGERVIQSDLLTIPHKSLLDRPFALWPLADVAPFWLHQGQTAAQLVEPWGSRFSGEAPFRTRQIHHRIDTPQLVGTVNVTPDSFADGNQYLQVDRAIQQALHLVNSGADIIDIGAESTSPTAEAITADVEWQRLQPVLAALQSQKANFLLPPKISIDTRHASTAEKAVAYDIHWINDVTGLDDPAMRTIVKEAALDCVVMHHLSIPERRSHLLPRDQNTVKLVFDWGRKRLDELETQGIPRQQIIFDPGVGFGKMAEQSFDVLKNIADFAALGTRLYVGHSRKSLFNLLTHLPFADRDIETTAVSLFLAKQPVDFLRVHNVEMSARALKVSACFC